MKYAIVTLSAGLALAVTASSASAFGRGGVVAGGRVGPAGGYRGGVAAGGVSTGPFGGVQAGRGSASTWTGPGGTTVQRAAGRGASIGPLGGVNVGGASATRVTTPGGRTFTEADAGRARVGPAGGVSVGGVSGAAYRGPAGGAAVGRAGGVAVGPVGGVRVGSVTAGGVRAPFGGGVAVGSRTGVAVGPAGGVRVGHATAYVSPTAVRTSATVVRGGYVPHTFTRGWYTTHRDAWVAPRWVAGYTPWRPVVWGTAAAFVGITAAPIIYDYGSTVVIQDDVVYVNGDPAASATDYAAQADALADAGRRATPGEDEEWQPLGVFGLIREDEKIAQRIFQLAVNKDGIVRGNYYDAVADNNLPVAGSLDRKSQRVAWSIGDKKDIVFETGLSNLTQDQATVLVHFGKESTQQMILVRLEEPKDEK